MKIRVYQFDCFFCQKSISISQTSKLKALIIAHKRGWASTSVESSTAKHACEACAKKPAAKRDFCRSLWVCLPLQERKGA